MKLTFLGTGTSQGVPVIACNCNVCKSNDSRDIRLRSSAMININDKVIIIDSGPDFRQQMLKEKVTKLDALLLSHGHKDHIAGLDDVRAFNYVQKKAIDVYARLDVHETIKNEFSYAFAVDKYPGVPEINLHIVENKPFSIDEIEIIPIEVQHFKLNIFAYRIGDLTYITDANRISNIELAKIIGSKVVVINALRKTTHVSHFNLYEALKIIEKISPQKAYITHISHLMGLHREVEKELPKNIELAYDGLNIEI